MGESAKPDKKITPMMQQWLSLKAQAARELLFFRLGDFYELFGEDAKVAAPLMGVALTSRNQKDEEALPLCGVPAAHFETYLNKILDAGHCVALAEQTEEAGAGKKLVRREIVQHFSPGMRLFDSGEEPHYAAVFVGEESRWAVAAADVATGHLVMETHSGFEALQELIKRLPIEDLRSAFDQRLPVSCRYQASLHLESLDRSESRIGDQLQLSEMADSPCENSLEVQALGTLFRVLSEAHPRHALKFLRPQNQPDAVWMGAATRRHLQLFEPKEHCLFRSLDFCQTAFGRRELKTWLSFPTQNLERIRYRQKRVRFLKSKTFIRHPLQKKMASIRDLHRLLRKTKRASQLFQLSESFFAGLESVRLLEKHDTEGLFQSLSEKTQNVSSSIEDLRKRLRYSEKENEGWIAEGVSTELDELRALAQDSVAQLRQLEARLRDETGVATLKIKSHQVFGYVGEVTRLHRDRLPKRARHIQSLANAERFKTPEIEELEEKLFSLDARLLKAEEALWREAYEMIEAKEADYLLWIEALAELDVLMSLAEASFRGEWSTPEYVSEDQVLILEKATHPLIVEKLGESFVPLDLRLQRPEQSLILLTGPNMAGKSTCLRVAALSALLHQIGSDVPAQNARLSLFDRIMCRMGAMDDLSQGKSTFFVEMREVASMLSGATERSLLLFDELGRGTSTYDGMSLAWAITEELHDRQVLAMVATHYLEMADLEAQLSSLKNYHLAVIEKDQRLIFTRQLKRGPASQSYGIQVAQLAELPSSILERARHKLSELENQRNRSHENAKPWIPRQSLRSSKPLRPTQPSLF